MTSKPLQILDDNATDFKYSGGQWTLSTLVQWYQGTSNYPGFASSSTFGSFSLKFEGTSIAFVGNTPTGVFSQIATVSIDGSPPSNITYPSTLSPPAYTQWYQSPTLSDGVHTITVGHLDGTAVDYALIEVGQNTPLAGKTIVVDNDDSAIQFSGNWARSEQGFNAGTLPDGLPFHNSTHRSSRVGDTITFRFTGTSAAVYGIFNWADLGILSATYTLDGTTTPQSYSVTQDSPQYSQDFAEAVNFLYFSQENLPAGDHTLIVNITGAQNQLFIFDYITYTPSFSTLATMPNLTVVPTSSTSSLSTNPSDSTKPPSGSTSSNGLPNFQSNHNTNRASAGAIAGGVVGGVIALASIAFFIFWSRKRRSKSKTLEKPTAFNLNSDGQSVGTVTPFQATLNDAPVSHGSIADPKRERADPSNSRPATVLTLPASAITSTDKEHVRDQIPELPIGGPPAYEAFPTHNHAPFDE